MAGLHWPGLMAWSTKYHDGTAPSNFKQMSDEDRQFLQKAMEEAFGKVEDPNVVMKEAILQVSAADRTDESIMTALEVIDRLADDPDIARNVEKLGGLQPLLDLVSTHEGPIRMRTLEVLALLFSNNPSIQKVGVERGAKPLFLRLAREAPRCSEQRGKAFRALVALVRQVPAYEEALLRGAGGCGLLVELLHPEEEARTREKAASFVRSLAGDGRLEAEEARALAVAITGLLHGLEAEGVSYRETLASCALELAQSCPAHCPGDMAKAVQARLAQLQTADNPDAEHEASVLQHILALPTAPSGAA